MALLHNHHRPNGLPEPAGLATGQVLSDPTEALRLLAHCPASGPAPLREMPDLARKADVGDVFLKDERGRMGMGSFKALGAAYAIARIASERAAGAEALAENPDRQTILNDMVFACASAGNHGLSVAVGAHMFGARAIVYLAETVPEAFAERLRGKGAQVVRKGADYEASMVSALADCETNGWTLLSDSSWPGYVELPMRVMEGYLVSAAEVVNQIASAPTHIFLQAGVGGFAAAMAAHFRTRWGDGPTIIVVEPDRAATLLKSIAAGRPVEAPGPVSVMGRLDCKEPSHLALGALARDADFFMTVTDPQSIAAVGELGRLGMGTTPSGAAGVAGLLNAAATRAELGLDGASRVLAFITETGEDAA